MTVTDVIATTLLPTFDATVLRARVATLTVRFPLYPSLGGSDG